MAILLRAPAGEGLPNGDDGMRESDLYDPPMNYELYMGEALAEAQQALARDDSGLDAYAKDSRAEAVRVIALAHRLTRLANVPRPIRPLRNAVLRFAGRLGKTQDGLAKQLAGFPER